MRVEEGFQPISYTEGNPYTTDNVLPSLFKRLLPRDVFTEVDKELQYFGVEVLTTLRDISKTVAEPQLVQYDHWGKRIDDLQTSEGWRGLKAKMQREGVVGIFYERQYKEYSRVLGFAKMYLANGDAHVIFCPLGMTDGSARVLETIGTPAMKKEILPRLISRDPDIAFTAGQWMTERPGGSDVSQTETVATPVPNASSPYGPVYTLHGFKWFSSATDSDVALALARTGTPTSGSRGLSLFLVPLRYPLLRAPGAPRPSALTNHIKVHRLKNKVGTKIVPTAELELDGAEAYRLGEEGQGVKLITPVLNITRMHSAISSVGALRRCLAVATAYADVRAIKGGRELLRDNALHVAELAKVNVLYRALAHLVFNTVLLLGKSECGVASAEEEGRLRMLTPAAKAFAAEKAVTAMEECMTSLGGQGYMEETMFGTNIRDTLVEKIWEGTITVMSLDMVRAASKPGIVEAWSNWAASILASTPTSLAARLSRTLSSLRTATWLTATAYNHSTSGTMPPLLPRPALILFSYATCALYLLEHAIWAHANGETGAEADVEVVRRWVEESEFAMAVEGVERILGEEVRIQQERVRRDKDIVFGSAKEAQKTSGAKEPQLRARL